MKILEATLKNARKYSNISFAKAVNLGNYKTSLRKKDEFSDGYSMRKDSSKWFILPDGKCIFKDYSGIATFMPTKKIRILNEILCYKLASQIDLDCARYEMATYQGREGTISYNVCKTNEKILSAHSLFSQINPEYDYSLESFAELLDTVMESGTALDREQVLFDLFKQMVFDTLTFQTDRHENNIHFLLNSKEDTIRVAPLIDNEFAFGGKLVNKIIYYGELESLRSEYKNDDDKFIDYYVLNASMFLASSFGGKIFKKNVDAIGYLCFKNEKYKEEVNKYIKKLNVKKAFSELKKEGYKISKPYEKYVEGVVDLAKKKLKQALDVKYEEDYTDDFLDTKKILLI